MYSCQLNGSLSSHSVHLGTGGLHHDGYHSITGIFQKSYYAEQYFGKMGLSLAVQRSGTDSSKNLNEFTSDTV